MFELWKSLIMPKVFSFADGDGGSDTGDSSQSQGDSDDVSDDDLDDDGFIAKRGAKNVREELRRRKADSDALKAANAELERLKAEIAKPKEDPKPNQTPNPQSKRYEKIAFVKAFVDKYHAAGTSKEFLEDLAEMIIEGNAQAGAYHVSEKLKGINLERLTKTQQRELEKDMDDTISAFKSEHEFVLEKWGKEIKDAIKKNYKSEFWDNKDIVEAEIGKAYARHAKDITGEADVPSVGGKLNDTDVSGGSGGADGDSPDEYTEFCISNGFQNASPAEKKASQNAFKAYKRVQALRNQ